MALFTVMRAGTSGRSAFGEAGSIATPASRLLATASGTMRAARETAAVALIKLQLASAMIASAAGGAVRALGGHHSCVKRTDLYESWDGVRVLVLGLDCEQTARVARAIARSGTGQGDREDSEEEVENENAGEEGEEEQTGTEGDGRWSKRGGSGGEVVSPDAGAVGSGHKGGALCVRVGRRGWRRRGAGNGSAGHGSAGHGSADSSGGGDGGASGAARRRRAARETSLAGDAVDGGVDVSPRLRDGTASESSIVFNRMRIVVMQADTVPAEPSAEWLMQFWDVHAFVFVASLGDSVVPSRWHPGAARADADADDDALAVESTDEMAGAMACGHLSHLIAPDLLWLVAARLLSARDRAALACTCRTLCGSLRALGVLHTPLDDAVACFDRVVNASCLHHAEPHLFLTNMEHLEAQIEAGLLPPQTVRTKPGQTELDAQLEAHCGRIRRKFAERSARQLPRRRYAMNNDSDGDGDDHAHHNGENTDGHGSGAFSIVNADQTDVINHPDNDGGLNVENSNMGASNSINDGLTDVGSTGQVGLMDSSSGQGSLGSLGSVSGLGFAESLIARWTSSGPLLEGEVPTACGYVHCIVSRSSRCALCASAGAVLFNTLRSLLPLETLSAMQM